MELQTFARFRLLSTIAITLITAAVLISQHYDQGVAAHYLFHNPDMPRMSNWWALVILPVLVWVCTGFVARRLNQSPQEQQQLTKQAAVGFITALLYGAAIAAFYNFGISAGASGLFFAIPILGLFFKVYRAEYILGFVLGMSFIFGVVLPTLFGLIAATIAWLVYQVVSFCKNKLFKAAA